MQSVTELLKTLIGIPSVNPEDETRPEFAGEARMAEFIDGYLSNKGFATERIELKPGRPNIIARYGAEHPSRTLFIEGHMDTVSIANMTVDPFNANEECGRIYGRGASDMKGPTAAALWAMDDEVLEAIKLAGKQIGYLACIDEEKGARGARQMAETDFHCDEMLVLEPTQLNLVLAHKAPAWIRVEVTGRAGHGAHPERGINAIEGMAKAIEIIRDVHQRHLPNNPHPLLGMPSINIGTIEGGQGTNIIPDRCCIGIDRRILPGEDLSIFMADLNTQLSRLRESGHVLAIEVKSLAEGEAFETHDHARLVQRLQKAHPAAQRQGSAWFSDAGPLSACCDEIVVFGPGSIEQAHTKDEYIDITALQEGAAVLRDFLMAFAAE